MQHHNYSLSDVENMMPWERDIYVDMLIEHIKEENKKQEEQNRRYKEMAALPTVQSTKAGQK